MGRRKKIMPNSTAIDCYEKKLPICTLEESIEQNKKLANTLLTTHNFAEDMGSTQMFIINQVIQPLNYFKKMYGITKSAEDYERAFECFKDIINQINEHITFTPTVNTFCKFLNISTITFNAYARQNSDIGDVFTRISDYLGDNIMQNMLGRRIDAIPGIFICKANLGMRDSESNNVNIINVNNQTKSLDEILADFKKNGV